MTEITDFQPTKPRRIIYLDCSSGICGDMLLGALVDVGVPFELLQEAIASLGISGLVLEQSEVMRGGFRAKKVDVVVPHEHAHRHLSDILAIIERGNFSDNAKKIAVSLFKRLAQAEAIVHGTAVEEVHFHEVGAADSIADIIGISVGIDYLAVDRINSSAVVTGSGQIQIAHGTCSIPAPATATLLTGIPIEPGPFSFEMTTPTGAVFLSVLVNGFSPLPSMSIEKIGLGAGTREIPGAPNVLRLILGTVDDEPSSSLSSQKSSEPEHHRHESGHCHHHDHGDETHHCHCPQRSASNRIHESLLMVETNLDDMTGEGIAYLQERLWQLKPRDIFITPILMKKQRPAFEVRILIDPSQLGEVEKVIFEETSSWGVRHYPIERTRLICRPVTLETPWGDLPGKVAEVKEGLIKFKPEYDAIATIAQRENIPLEAVRAACRLKSENEDI